MSDPQPGCGSRRCVVVGVDGSPNSLAALNSAAARAGTRSTDLSIVYVIPDGSSPDAEASGYTMLDVAVRTVAPHGLSVPADRMVARGGPAEVLARLSARAGLLVIGARFNSQSGNLLGGDVVPYVLSHAHCEVDICADHQASRRLCARTRATRSARSGPVGGSRAAC